MAGNYQNILHHQDCIPEEKLLAYIEGSLTSQEANRVEQHLLECELCTDALEGLRMLHPDKVRAITAELNSKIDQRLESLQNLTPYQKDIAASGRSAGQAEKGTKVLPFGSFYRIAAIIVLVALVGGGYWLMKIGKEENNIAINQKSEPAVTKDSVAVQIKAPAGSVSTGEVTASLKKEIASTTPKFSPENKQRESEQPLAFSATKESKDQSNIKDDVGKKGNDDLTSQSDSFYTGNEVALSKVDNSNVSRNQASNAIEDYQSSKSAPAAADMDVSNAMKDESEMLSYKKNKESKSANQSGTFSRQADQKTSTPFDEKSSFDRGKLNYDLKIFDAAANDFEKLIKDTASQYYDDSKWFLANCYMRTNRSSKAKKLLQEISNSNSVHKKEAFGLLQEH